uniref:Uncharacterized protein n=1 Tax=uncultured bacterium contig00030 TaxID=1181519 RepID=A0A806KIT9_9BACT|nr:hypothetical protein [uncultured bacterium contig00030]
MAQMPQSARQSDFFDRVQLVTESYLTYRKRKNRVKKKKERQKTQYWTGLRRLFGLPVWF